MLSHIYATWSTRRNESGEHAIGVAGVVVVRCAVGIDITEVRRVADVRRGLPPISRGHTIYNLY